MPDKIPPEHVGMMRLTAALLERGAELEDAWQRTGTDDSPDVDLTQFFPDVEVRRELMRRYYVHINSEDDFDAEHGYESVPAAALMNYLAAQIEDQLEAIANAEVH